MCVSPVYVRVCLAFHRATCWRTRHRTTGHVVRRTTTRRRVTRSICTICSPPSTSARTRPPSRSNHVRPSACVPAAPCPSSSNSSRSISRWRRGGGGRRHSSSVVTRHHRRSLTPPPRFLFSDSPILCRGPSVCACEVCGYVGVSPFPHYPAHPAATPEGPTATLSVAEGDHPPDRQKDRRPRVSVSSVCLVCVLYIRNPHPHPTRSWSLCV